MSAGAANGAAGYSPIEDYGAIGNLRTVALVSRTGSIDWCCLPELDSGSVFGALLDHARGGSFRIAPVGAAPRGDQRYVPGTNVLVTSWHAGGAHVSVQDFMPLAGSILGTGDPPTAPRIFRIIECEHDDCDVDVMWSPRFDYARARMTMEVAGTVAVASGGDERMQLEGLPPGARVEADSDGGPVLRARLRLRAGERLPLLTAYGEEPALWSLRDWERALRGTTEAWRAWVASRDEGEPCEFAGAWQPLLERSGLALKLLTYPRSGAIAAAATTSLPEEIGGVRNWDYRYTWIRDASFTAQAMVALGHRGEATEFLEWAEHVCMHDDQTAGRLHLMYRLDGSTDITESELPHLDGYRGSRPVRIGNKAADQFQLDIYGELLGAAYELVRLGGRIDDRLWQFLTAVADKACSRWQEPDYGIWEVRSDPQHFVYSKLMVYVALDRALRLADRFGLDADRTRWRRTRDAVRADILERGWNEERGAFVQAYGTEALDAANLMMGAVGFLPLDDPRMQSTIDRSLDELTENGLVYRYRTDQAEDGIEGHEGAFGLTTFWMIDALALSGRLDEANAMFEGVARRANHVGLYSEEFDPSSGAFLGNFPQAFSHIGFINSAVYIAHAEGRPTPQPAPIGTAEEQREREGGGHTATGERALGAR